MTTPADVIFCGNPGAGKSTLLSCVSGRQFRSGESAWCGFCSDFQFQESCRFPGYRFADTPGLADCKSAENAAKAITQTLMDAVRKGRAVKLFFVVPSEGGRITAEHLLTIRKVLGCITLVDGTSPSANSYAVIINKCDTALPEHQARVREGFAVRSPSLPIPTCHVIFLPRVGALSGKDNASHHFEGLQDFVLNVPAVALANVAEISCQSTVEELKQLQQNVSLAFDEQAARHEAEKRRWEQDARDVESALREAYLIQLRQEGEAATCQLQQLRGYLASQTDRVFQSPPQVFR